MDPAACVVGIPPVPGAFTVSIPGMADDLISRCYVRIPAYSSESVADCLCQYFFVSVTITPERRTKAIRLGTRADKEKKEAGVPERKVLAADKKISELLHDCVSVSTLCLLEQCFRKRNNGVTKRSSGVIFVGCLEQVITGAEVKESPLILLKRIF